MFVKFLSENALWAENPYIYKLLSMPQKYVMDF